ncbi:hypothetical protein DFH08DRAFT_808351 [Mycena albidolilacea]|uniref:Uncharacterized protein n=1 Tax=Mycena albidolilacea TaxID=1033008 RepID=A0AAD7A388_9AGAR|nr:hypothetical protein DFH08DRAFT_808351 [Mycena albidolilacea]
MYLKTRSLLHLAVLREWTIRGTDPSGGAIEAKGVHAKCFELTPSRRYLLVVPWKLEHKGRVNRANGLWKAICQIHMLIMLRKSEHTEKEAGPDLVGGNCFTFGTVEERPRGCDRFGNQYKGMGNSGWWEFVPNLNTNDLLALSYKSGNGCTGGCYIREPAVPEVGIDRSATFRAFRSYFLSHILPQLVVLAGTFVLYVSDKSIPKERGPTLLAAYFVVYISVGISNHVYSEKGAATTYMSVDLEKVASRFQMFHGLWADVVTIIIACTMLWYKADNFYVMCAPLLLIIALIGTTSFVSRFVGAAQKAWLKAVNAWIKHCVPRSCRQTLFT